MAEFTLRIDGMHCGSCIRRVTQALASVEGARSRKCGWARRGSTPPQAPAPVDLALAALAQAGYAAQLEP